MIAAGLVPAGTRFSGFLINPADGYSYLAKMRQGLDGAWDFTLPYAGTPSGGVAIFLFYIALGHLARVLQFPLLTIYQAARVVGGFLMFISIYVFLKAVIPNRMPRWMAMAFVLLGSGVGWMGLVAGLQGSDLLIPESIPFVTAFTNPHFPVALGLVALGATLIVAECSWRLRAIGGLGIGLGLGVVLPFSVVPLIGAGAAWSLWDGLRSRARDGRMGWVHHPGWVAVVGIAIGGAPWLSYDFWVVTAKPSFAAWNAQNLTPSPPVWDYALGFGLILGWALYGVVRSEVFNQRRGRFLAAWLVVNGLLLYAPIGLQRRFSLGLFVPLAALAGLGAAGWVGRSARWGWLLFTLSLLLSLPSNGLVVGAGLATAAAGSPLVTETIGDAQAYAWLSEHAAPGAVVLASAETGIRLPAFAPVKVVAGHPFETPQVQARTAQIRALFEGKLSGRTTDQWLDDWGVTYVFYGPRERALGPPPPWTGGFLSVFEAAGVTIYARAAP